MTGRRVAIGETGTYLSPTRALPAGAERKVIVAVNLGKKWSILTWRHGDGVPRVSRGYWRAARNGEHLESDDFEAALSWGIGNDQLRGVGPLAGARRAPHTQ